MASSRRPHWVFALAASVQYLAHRAKQHGEQCGAIPGGCVGGRVQQAPEAVRRGGRYGSTDAPHRLSLSHASEIAIPA
jgi:hypothetical protein